MCQISEGFIATSSLKFKVRAGKCEASQLIESIFQRGKPLLKGVMMMSRGTNTIQEGFLIYQFVELRSLPSVNLQYVDVYFF